jgi:two-component system response regulator HydG
MSSVNKVRSAKILLVDDDRQALDSTRKILEFSGFEVITAVDGQAALEKLRPAIQSLGFDPQGANQPSIECIGAFDLVITDVRMPRLGGLEFLRVLSVCGDGVPVILMTAFGKIEDAVWAMKLGAVDFLIKPFKKHTLMASVEAALKRSHLKPKRLELGGVSIVAPGAVSGSPPHGDLATQVGNASDPLIGQSPAMQGLKEMIRRVAATHANILLTGESGTGKELVARCIHQQSSRFGKKLIALNCAAVPEQLIESELFGYEKGAFSGAIGVKEGLFEAAHGGTLLLDEVGDMPLPLQAKLLRVLQENEVRRLGATVSKKVDVRVIAATHKDLKQCVKEGLFRQDLLFRLEVVGIHVPPLRERQEDIVSLSLHFLQTASHRHGKRVQGIDESAMSILLRHSWPGNVRELSNVIERGVVFVTGSQITLAELPAHLSELIPAELSSANTSAANAGAVNSGPTIEVPLGTSLKDVEELLILKTLEATAGDKNMTAKLLGINSRTIYRKLDKRADKEPLPD